MESGYFGGEEWWLSGWDDVMRMADVQEPMAL